ncbi:expressed unknown protein [Seminavis robusta]|uniref:Uncharacterized protein n=1 Tax=Seminavis robusta TaxID=568900 RepID=A0A9N8HDJ4_9STRA|nr:expressed unknown protein [Seminavis robusta]|eukprot:Sro346_g122770.1 n/a (592) ;mRNA; r:67728-69598
MSKFCENDSDNERRAAYASDNESRGEGSDGTFFADKNLYVLPPFKSNAIGGGGGRRSSLGHWPVTGKENAIQEQPFKAMYSSHNGSKPDAMYRRLSLGIENEAFRAPEKATKRRSSLPPSLSLRERSNKATTATSIDLPPTAGFQGKVAHKRRSSQPTMQRRDSLFMARLKNSDETNEYPFSKNEGQLVSKKHAAKQPRNNTQNDSGSLKVIYEHANPQQRTPWDSPKYKGTSPATASFSNDTRNGEEKEEISNKDEKKRSCLTHENKAPSLWKHPGGGEDDGGDDDEGEKEAAGKVLTWAEQVARMSDREFSSHGDRLLHKKEPKYGATRQAAAKAAASPEKHTEDQAFVATMPRRNSAMQRGSPSPMDESIDAKKRKHDKVQSSSAAPGPAKKSPPGYNGGRTTKLPAASQQQLRDASVQRVLIEESIDKFCDDVQSSVATLRTNMQAALRAMPMFQQGANGDQAPPRNLGALAPPPQGARGLGMSYGNDPFQMHPCYSHPPYPAPYSGNGGVPMYAGQAYYPWAQWQFAHPVDQHHPSTGQFAYAAHNPSVPMMAMMPNPCGPPKSPLDSDSDSSSQVSDDPRFGRFA